MSSPAQDSNQAAMVAALAGQCPCQPCNCPCIRVTNAQENDVIDEAEYDLVNDDDASISSADDDYHERPTQSLRQPVSCSRSSREHIQFLSVLLRYRFAVENEATLTEALRLVFETRRLRGDGPPESMEASFTSTSSAAQDEDDGEELMQSSMSMAVEGGARSGRSSMHSSTHLKVPTASASRPAGPPNLARQDSFSVLQDVGGMFQHTCFPDHPHNPATESECCLGLSRPQRSFTYPLIGVDAPFHDPGVRR